MNPGGSGFGIRDYVPGDVGRVTEAHAVYYHQHWGFDVSFETQVGRELSEFMASFDGERSAFWAADWGGRFAGSVALDGRDCFAAGARVRWFIVKPEFQSRGLGRDLIGRTVDFCRGKVYPRIFLWTFRGLDTARRLYESAGFRLTEEHDVRQWGREITEQKFELDLSV